MSPLPSLQPPVTGDTGPQFPSSSISPVPGSLESDVDRGGTRSESDGVHWKMSPRGTVGKVLQGFPLVRVCVWSTTRTPPPVQKSSCVPFCGTSPTLI